MGFDHLIRPGAHLGSVPQASACVRQAQRWLMNTGLKAVPPGLRQPVGDRRCPKLLGEPSERVVHVLVGILVH